jgi:hypothetical protein
MDQSVQAIKAANFLHARGHHAPLLPFAAPADAGTTSPDVLHRRQQPAAGDGLVGDVAGGCALAIVRAAPADAVCRLAACVRHAVPDAAEFHLRLPAHRVPALDGPAGDRALALPAGGPGTDRWPTGNVGRGIRLRPRGGGWLLDDTGRLAGRRAHPRPAAAPRARHHLACAGVLPRFVAGRAGIAGVGRLPARRGSSTRLRQHQAGHLRPAAAGVLLRGPSTCSRSSPAMWCRAT